MIDPSPPRPPRPIGRRVGAALVLALLLGACGGSSGDAPGAPSASEADTSTSTTAAGTTTSADGSVPSATTADPGCPAPEGELSVFGATVVVVVAGDGAEVERCVLVADEGALRNQGLMRVTDLGPYDGMVFAYAGVSTGGYWMKDTPMPLTIAWIGVDGRVVATADMDPCLDQGSDCPSYDPGATYRWALEVPQGELAAFGLTDGAAFEVSSLPAGLD